MMVLALICVVVSATVASGYVLFAGVLGWRRYRHAFGQRVTSRLGESFLFPDPELVWLANLGMCGVLAAGVFIISASLLAAALTALAAAAVPHQIVACLRRRRIRRFEAQLPDFIQMLAGALRAGAGLHSALRQLAPQSPDPLAQELGLMLQQQRMGMPWDAALAGLRERMQGEGAALMVSALSIAARSGGALAQTLEGVSATLRARLRTEGRIDALTSQGRLQAWLMSGMPAALGLALYLLDPQAMNPLWTTPEGWAVLALLLVLQVAGIMLVRRIARIEV